MDLVHNPAGRLVNLPAPRLYYSQVMWIDRG
jgi:hypothetical protein